MKLRYLAILAAIVLGISGLTAHFASPRTVVVAGPTGTLSGLTVEILIKVAPEQSTTDGRGVATFGRGPWLPLFEENRLAAVRISRGDTTLFDGLKVIPRWGSIHVSVSKT